MKIHNIEQQTDEWFKMKAGKFSASDAQAIATAGTGLTTLCYKKVAERISGMIEIGYTNSDIERGNELESAARTAYEIRTKRSIVQVGFVEASKSVGCSPDGLVGKKGLVEIKCPNGSNFIKHQVLGIPSKYKWQMQMQMFVCEREWCDFVAYNENFSDIFVARVKRNETRITGIKAGLKIGEEKIKEIMDRLGVKK